MKAQMTSFLFAMSLGTLAGPAAAADKVTQSFDAKDLTDLDLANSVGKVTISGADDGNATVVADKVFFEDGCDLEIAKSGGKLKVSVKAKSRFFFRSKCEVNLDVKVPKAVDLDVKLGSGSLAVTGTQGTVTYKTGSGEIAIDGEITQLDGKSGSGSVMINGLVGNGEVKSGSGDISLTYTKAPASGSLDVKSGSGNTTVTLPTGSHVKTSFLAGSGELINELGDTPGAPFSIAAKAGSGNLTIKRL